MNTIMSTITRGMLVISAFALGLFAVSTASATETDPKGEHFASVAVPTGLAASDIQDAIVATLLGRQWGVKSKADGEVVGYLKHRSNEATVTLTFDTSKVDIYCVGYKIDKSSGSRIKPEQPKGWLKNIQQDLTKNLNKTISHK